MSTENISAAVAEEIPNLLITPTAQEYLFDLLEKQNTPGIAVRVFVENPGTPRAECCMAYSAPEEIININLLKQKVHDYAPRLQEDKDTNGNFDELCAALKAEVTTIDEVKRATIEKQAKIEAEKKVVTVVFKSVCKGIRQAFILLFAHYFFNITQLMFIGQYQ